jgi:hypothetical protein
MNTMIRFQRKPNRQILYIEYHYKESTDPAQYPGQAINTSQRNQP